MPNTRLPIVALFSTALLLFAPGVALVSPVALARDNTRTQRVQFKPGTSSATVEGSIAGYQSVDYVLNVRAGQTLNASPATKNTATYFNVLEPGQREEAIFIGSTSGNQFEGKLERSGDYRIRVYYDARCRPSSGNRELSIGDDRIGNRRGRHGPGN
jgi:hypothetical protein